jgi:hypothetical protein
LLRDLRPPVVAFFPITDDPYNLLTLALLLVRHPPFL